MWEILSTGGLASVGTIILLVILFRPQLIVQLFRNAGDICISLLVSAVSVAASAISTIVSSPTTIKIATSIHHTVCDIVLLITSPRAWANMAVRAVQAFFGVTERTRGILTPADPQLNLRIPPPRRPDSVLSFTSSTISTPSSAFDSVSLRERRGSVWSTTSAFSTAASSLGPEPGRERRGSIFSTVSSAFRKTTPSRHQCAGNTGNGRCLRTKVMMGFTGDWYCFQHIRKRPPGLEAVKE